MAAGDWHPATTLPGPAYFSDGVFAEECARLFHGGWVCVGRVEDAPVPGAWFEAEVVSESVLIVRDETGRLRAFLNLCRHRGARLCSGQGRLRGPITCPYHAWSYALDGRLVATPNIASDEPLPRDRLALHDVPLSLWEGYIFVDLSGSATALEAHLTRAASDNPFTWQRYGTAGLVTGASRQWEVAANWKIIIENYNECLHCPVVHPELVRIVPFYRRGEVEEVPGWSGNRLAPGLTSFSLSGRSSLPALPGLDEQDRNSYCGLVLLPNLIVNFNSDEVVSFHLFPLGPERTRVVYRFLFRPETVAAPGFDPSELVAFRELLAQQDWAVCERTQAGMRSRGYAAGGILPYADRFVHAFQRQYRTLMGDADDAPAAPASGAAGSS